jgi:hypothetical protein
MKMDIDITKKGVVWEGFGTSLAWFAHGIQAELSVKEYLAKLLFDQENEKGLQLNIVRYNIGGGYKDSSLREGGDVPGYFGNLDSVDLNQRFFLKKAKEYNISKIEAFSNTPPINMTVSDNVQGTKKRCRCNLQPNHIDDFANYLVKVLVYLKYKDGIDFTSISPINEPSGPGWIIGCGQEACFYGFCIRTKLFKILKTKLLENKETKNIMLSGCEENNILQGIFAIILNPFSLKYIDRFNIHRYRISDSIKIKTYNIEDSLIFKRLINWTMKTIFKKKIWMSEYGLGFENGVVNSGDVKNVLSLANSIIDDINVLGCCSWVYWQAIENKSTNGWGLLQVPFNNCNLENIEYSSQFNAIQHFTHFIKPGDYILKNLQKTGNKNVKYISSFNSKTGKINIIILNKDSSDFKLEFTQYYNFKIMESFAKNSIVPTICTNNYNLNSSNIIIKSNSLVSIECRGLSLFTANATPLPTIPPFPDFYF